MSPNYRVAYVMQNTGVDMRMDAGQTILIRETIRGLERAGHDVSLISLQGRAVMGVDDLGALDKTWAAAQGISGARPFRWLESAVRRGQTVARLPYFALFDSFRFYEACVRTLPQFDVCHEYAGLLSLGAALACRRLRMPYVLTSDADLLLESAVMGRPLRGLRKAAAQWVARTSYRLADRIICVSEPARDHLVKNWQVDLEKIVVMPNGVDVEKFHPDKHQNGRQMKPQRPLNLPESVPIVMFVGSFQAWHGLDRLMAAFAKIIDVSPQARLILVGDGPERAATAVLARELGIADQVIFTGSVTHDEVPRLLNAADVVTLPYPPLPQELWFSPLKLYEYMAAGCAIVASASGQIVDVVQDGETGLLVPPGEVDALATAVLSLLQDPARRLALGEKARATTVAHHSWDAQIKRLTAVYEQVMMTYAA